MKFCKYYLYRYVTFQRRCTTGVTDVIENDNGHGLTKMYIVIGQTNVKTNPV